MFMGPFDKLNPFISIDFSHNIFAQQKIIYQMYRKCHSFRRQQRMNEPKGLFPRPPTHSSNGWKINKLLEVFQLSADFYVVVAVLCQY